MRAGDCLYWQGEADHSGFAIERGWIALEVDTGGETLCIIDFVLPGDILASTARMHRRPGHTARCMTESVVRSATHGEIAAFATATGDFAEYLDHCVTARLFRVQDNLANIATRDAYGRVAHLLYGLYCRTRDGDHGGAGGIICPLRHRHIGAATGLSTVHVSRILGLLASRGIVALKSNLLTVVDRTGLEQAAGEFEAELADPVLARSSS